LSRLLFLVCLACEPGSGPDPDPDSADSQQTVSLLFQSSPQSCIDPMEGFARYTEEATLRGLNAVLPNTERPEGQTAIGRGGAVVAQDMDADGDTDLLFHPMFADPLIYLNDGTGHFSLLSENLSNDPGLYKSGVNAAAATDLDGDFLPEILVASAGSANIYWSDNGTWKPSETIHQDERPQSFSPTAFAAYLSLSLGDFDGDNDLDLVLPGTGSLSEGDPRDAGGPDRVFENQEGVFIPTAELINEGIGSRTMVAHFTDRDADGDIDLFIPADGGPPSSFWTHQGIGADGLPQWEDNAKELHANLQMAAMGIDGADLNQDGQLDYCITDRARPRCILTAQDGSYYESGQAMGIIAKEPANDRFTTTGWSIDFADLDNDGFLDLFQSSGPEGEAIELGLGGYPNLVWRGLNNTQFQDVSYESGLASTDNHYGHVVADFDDNGWLDLVAVGPNLQPELYMAACGSAHWLTLDLIGPGNNTEALGARIQARLSQRTDVREITGLRAQSQNPSRLHYGLGETNSIASITVRWPDGLEEKLTQLSADRHYTLVHPDASMPPWSVGLQ
jgi:enediyne biosynthesis protein E4